MQVGRRARKARSADRPLRIALYSQALPKTGASNGVVTYTRIIREALLELGHDVYVVTTEHIEDPNGRVTLVPPLNRLLAGLRLRMAAMRGEDIGDEWVRMNVRNAFEAVRRIGVDIFEIEETSGWAGDLTGRGVAIVERLHGPHAFIRDYTERPSDRIRGDRRAAGELSALSKAQAVTSPTRGLLDALIERHDLDLRLSRVIPNPITMAAPSERWELEQAKVTQLLAVGRFDLCKGADVVLRAFALAAKRRPELTLVMAGPDTGLVNSDGTLTQFDKFIAEEVCSDARSRITFLGPQPPSRIAELRLASGVAVVGSRFETFAYTIAEAMAAGMPVLTSATFGGRELIRDGIDGRVVAAADVEAMAEAMLEMTDDPGRLKAFGRSAYCRAADLLSPNLVARQTAELYREAIAGGSISR